MALPTTIHPALHSSACCGGLGWGQGGDGLMGCDFLDLGREGARC